MHRLRDLREEVSDRSVDNYQLAEELGEGNNAPIWGEHVQVAQTPDAACGASFGFGRDERDRQVDGVEDFGWQVEAKPWEVLVAARLDGHFGVLPWFRIAKLLDAHP